MQPNDQQPSTDGPNQTPAEPAETIITPTEQDTIAPEAPVEIVQPDATPSTLVAPQEAVTPAVAPAAAFIGLPPTQPVSGSELAKKQRVSKKVKTLAIIIGIAVVLIGGSVGAYFGVIVPNKPQRIVRDSLTNTVDIQKNTSAKFEGEVTCVTGDACKVFSAVLFSGAVNDKSNFGLKLQAKTAVTTIGLDARSVGDKSIYLRLSGLEGLDKLLAAYGGDATGSEASSLVAGYGPIIAKINNQWYNIDESLLKQAGGASIPTSSDSISKEDMQKIGTAYKNHQFIAVSKKLANEKIHDQDSYHIQATIDKTQLKAFATEVNSANIKDFKLEQKDIDGIDKVDFSKYPFDIWVSKSDRKITQLATTIKNEGTTAKLRLAIYDYNKPITVEKPAGAKSVLELMGELGTLNSGSNSSQTDSAKKCAAAYEYKANNNGRGTIPDGCE